MTYNVFGGTLNLAQFNSIHGADTDTGLLAILAMVIPREDCHVSACRSACMSYGNNFRKSRVKRVGEDPREDGRVAVGVVEFQLYGTFPDHSKYRMAKRYAPLPIAFGCRHSLQCCPERMREV